MLPKATVFSRCRGIGAAKAPKVGFAKQLLPLILTFSHPGEGTLVRYVSVILKWGT